MPHLNFSHSRSLFDPLMAQPLTVIGIGSIGGCLVSGAAKAGARDITVYDFDQVDSHNLPMSIYELDHVGHLKTEALADIVRRQSGVDLRCVSKAYAGEPLKGSVVVCVDTMAARAAVWERVRKNVNVPVLIDTRVAEKYLSVHMVDPRDEAMIKSYEKLFPDTKPAPQMCGRHGFITVSQITSAVGIEFLTEAWSSGTVERHFRVLTSELEKLVAIDRDQEEPEPGEEDDE